MGDDVLEASRVMLTRVSVLFRGEWAIAEDWLGEAGLRLSSYARALTSGDGLEAAERAERQGGDLPAAPRGVAIVPVHGVLLPRAPAWAALYGIGSTTAITHAVGAAARDNRTRAIVLHVDSPGGDVRGIEEAGDAIYAAAQVKPVIAVVEHVAASAGYWLASQAREIVTAPSGVLGSIGVITGRLDYTDALKDAGVRWHVLAAGPHKAEGHPATAMSDDERQAIEARLGALYGTFRGAVARGRRVAADDVEKRFGGGRTFYGREAVARGLADRIGGLGDVLASLEATSGSGKGERSHGGDPVAWRIEAELLRLSARG